MADNPGLCGRHRKFVCGNVQIAGHPGIVRKASDLPAGDLTLVAVDLIGTTIDPKEMKRLSSLTELRELMLPGPSFNPGAGSKLDANEEFAALANLRNLEKLWFSLHFLTEIHVDDKGLGHLKGLTQLRDEGRQRIAKVLVLASPEAVAGHDDSAAKTILPLVEGSEFPALLCAQ